MHRFVPSVLLAATLAFSSAATVEPAAAVAKPSKITSLSAVAGPGAGEITISWRQAGENTTAFQIEGAVNSFSPTKKGLSRHGRRWQLWTVPADRRSVTLSAAQVASAGASAASGNLLYYRVYAVNTTSAGTSVRRYPSLRAILPQPVAPKASGTELRAASFNVRTARKRSDRRKWLERAPDVARQILEYRPGVVALQELGPGRADGRSGSTSKYPRQTTSLISALQRAESDNPYRLVRTTPYVKPGSATGSQGARILYDNSRYTLLSRCPETTGGKNWSSSCTITMPLYPGRGAGERRKAVYAEFAAKDDGQRFFVVSAHLDSKHSGSTTKERKLEAHRGRQAQAVADAMASINTQDLPVVLGGDLNSWQNNKVADDAHEVLTAAGYYDSSSALARTNMGYATVNHFDRTVKENPQKVGARLDVVTVWGGRGAKAIVNVVKRVDAARPSDHNMVVADLVL